MLQVIKKINENLNYAYQFKPDRYNLYDNSKTCIYPVFEEDWHIYPLYGFQITKETERIKHFINIRIFNVLFHQIIKNECPLNKMSNTDIKMRIAISMIDKSSLNQTVKIKWINHLRFLYNERTTALMDYYFTETFPIQEDGNTIDDLPF